MEKESKEILEYMETILHELFDIAIEARDKNQELAQRIQECLRLLTKKTIELSEKGGTQDVNQLSNRNISNKTN